MDESAAIVGALGGLGLQTYAIASGQPYSTTSIGGVTTVQTGAAVNQTSYALILGIIVAAILAYVLLK